MTVPRSRETSAVYMFIYSSKTGDDVSIFICSKTGDEGSIYVARQGMRACNNNNMRNPSLHLFIMVLRMLVLLHTLIPCLAAYILSSSPVLLYIYYTCFSTFGTVIPTSFNILMEMFLLSFTIVSQSTPEHARHMGKSINITITRLTNVLCDYKCVV